MRWRETSLRRASRRPIVTTIAAAPSIHSIACELPPCFGSPPLPVAGGRGAVGGATTTVGVDVADAAGVGAADSVGDGVPDAVGVDVADAVGVEVAEPVGVDVADPVGVDVADPVGVGVSDVEATKFVTVAVQLTSAPPPLPEPLHWSTFTGSVVVIVDAPVTMHANPTLVPPLPEPLHCPTVAAVTDVTPGVFAGVQLPGAPVPVITEPTHW